MPHQYAWEDYFIPGTQTLKNLFGLVDPEELRTNEEDTVASRMLELQTAPVPGTFDLTHIRALHQHLFQDIYGWAGEVRTAPSADQSPMSKDGVAYAPVDRIAPIWTTERARIAKKPTLLRGSSSAADFSTRLARFWGEINHAHAFREGNTRTQVMFFEQLCEHAGYSLDIARLAPQHPETLREAFVDARYYFQLRGDAMPLAETITQVLTPLTKQTAVDPPQTAVLKASLDSQEQNRRFPELRYVQLDPYGLSEESPAQNDDSQLS
ncbi:Fic/DOC family protein [Cryobacterium luteum]|uniref:protein adenylyltransferase n=1 Tax=Cryobacterium luteum TaxID=1424661 RepID=A0A1H8L0U5_9MICO|nr:Fic family protein [Cryobacterium luteum]TFB82342.1 cell filamentation protein Fic [Cryobacterium luteum]SEN98719.1 cell filamentation protein [Cryobacterium luteum]